MAAQEQGFFRWAFLTPGENRLRSGWRLLFQLLLLLVFLTLLTLPLAFFDPASLQTNVLASLTAALGITASVFIARRFLDRRSFASLGLQVSRLALVDLLVGTLLMGIVMGTIYLVLAALGWLRFEGWAWQVQPLGQLLGTVLIAFIWFVLVGWQEELFVRGYQLQNLAEGLNLPLAVLLSSAFFSFYHLLNPGASWTSFVGLIAAGVFLAYGYLRTRQLWLPVGLHIGWNFFEGVVFGFPVSGLPVPALIRHTVTGPDLWTGGAFGPEAGLIVLPGLLLGAVLVYLYTRGRLRNPDTGRPETLDLPST